MSDEQPIHATAGNGNGNGGADTSAVARRLRSLEAHPWLLAKGFKAGDIQEAGWHVEALGERHARYGLPEDAGECEVWLIPYLHPNGYVWFERALFIDEADRARFGRHPGSPHNELYDPFLVLSRESPEPHDAILLVEGEANTVAAEALCAPLRVVGFPEGAALSARLASNLGHIPCVYLWLCGSALDRIENARYIADRLREAGVQEIRRVVDSPMTAEEALRELELGAAAEAANDLLAKAELVESESDDDWPLMPKAVPPRFPVDALPETMAAFVNAVATRTRTPVDMAAMGALGVLATVAMGATVDCGDWEEEALALYTLVISPSGDHKSTVLKAVAAPLYRIDAEERLEDKAAHASVESEQELLKARKQALIRKASKLEEEEEWAATQAELEDVAAKLAQADAHTEPRLLTDDSTAEGLARLMSKHPGGIAVASAEAAIVNNLLGHYSDQGNKANLSVVCKAFNGEGPIFVDRGGADPLFISRALLSLTLFAQPGVLKKVVGNETARDQGLIGRFIYAELEPASSVGHHDYDQHPPRVPAHLVEAWHQIVQRVRSASAPPQPPIGSDPVRSQTDSGGFGGFGGDSQEEGVSLTLSLSSQKLLVALLNALEPRKREGGDLRPFNDWLARHHGRIARIAALLHLTEHPPSQPIGEHTMRCALRIGEYLLDHMLIALTSPDPRTRRAMSYLGEKELTRVSLRDIHRMPPLNKRVPVTEAAELARSLVRLDALRPYAPAGEEPGPNGGRPRGPVFLVNPHLRKKKA